MLKRMAQVLFNGRLAGLLEERGSGKDVEYIFTYNPEYVRDVVACPVSLTLPKREESYFSKVLFPFFYGLLAEGRTKELQCRMLRIDESDHFGRLIVTCGDDCIGPVTVRQVEEVE